MIVNKKKVVTYEIESLTFPHEGGKVSVKYPSAKGYLKDISDSFQKDNLKGLTSAKNTSLVADAFKKPEKEYQSKIISILNDSWIREFTGLYYIPKGKGDFCDGVLFQDNPLIKYGKLFMYKNDLIAKLIDAEEFKMDNHPILISKDRLVRWTPFGYGIGEMTADKLAVNPFIIAQRLGREGNELEHSEDLARIASKYNSNPRVWSFDSVDEEKVRMSALSRGWGGGGLDVNGGDWDDIGSGHAFGVCKD